MTLLPAPKKSRRPEMVPHNFYQVDFLATNCGKMVAASKRRIRFKFGYSNAEALANGQTGQECRGSEHEVIVTWSLSSGKQAVAFDGQEIHFDVGDSTQTKFQHSWPDKFGNTLMVKIHAAPLSTKTNPDPDWRQYDFFVDGISFFHMPKIYELGVFPKEAPDDRPYARKVAAAKEASNDPHHFTFDSQHDKMQFSGNHITQNNSSPVQTQSQPAPVEVADLLSFDEADGAPLAVAPAPVQTQYPSATQDFAPTQSPFSAPAFASAPETKPAFANQPHNVITPTASPGNNDVYSNYQLGHDSTAFYANQQMNVSPVGSGQYQMNSSPFENNSMNISPAGPFNASPAVPTTVAPVATAPEPAFNTSTNSTALVPVQPNAQGVDGAVQSLVNLDDLFGSSAPITKQEMDKNMNDINAHRPLGELKASGSKNEPKKPIMNPFDAAPAYQNQGMYNGNASAQQPNPFNGFNYQQNYHQGYGQQGFQYQQPSY